MRKSNSFFRFYQKIFVTFRGRMLVTLFFLSISPLVLILYFAVTGSEHMLYTTRQQIEKAMLHYITYLHKENLDKQAARINEQLNSLEKQVQVIRTMASSFLTEPNSYSHYELTLTKEKEGYYWEKVEGDVSNAGVSAINQLTPEMKQRLTQSKALEPLFKEIVQQNSHVAAVYYISPQSYWRIYPKMNVKEEINNGYLTPNIDLTKRDFFSLAARSPNGEPVWTDTYVDLTHRKEMFSLSVPLHDRSGHFIGIIGIDITISQAIEHLLNFKFKEPSAYAVLISKNHRFIAYQPKAKHDLSILSTHLKTITSKQHPLSLNINGEDKIILCSTIQNTNWSLISVIPKKEIIDPIKQITVQKLIAYKKSFSLQFVSLLCFVAFILIISSIAIWKHFTTPIKELLDGISSVSAGNFRKKMTKQSLQEFRILISAFNSMAEKLDELIRNYEMLHSQLEEKVAERTAQLTKVNESLKQTNKKLKQLEQTRREMFENIAHDLKTPITLVLGYIEAIQDGIVSKEKNEEYLKRIYKHLHSINDLVKGIYELNHIETRSNAFQFELVDMNSFFTYIQDVYKNYSNIYFSICKNLPMIKMDAKYMERVIFNLIDNALKYSDAHSPIEIYVKQEETFIIVIIRDFGWGIPEKDLPYIFDRFYRVDKARNSHKPGNGLGLTIVKEVIHAHGGKIDVTSKLGEGTTFTIYLPIR
jgi:signal transduction histidine kinase